MNNELELLNKEWYSIKEIAELSGYDLASLKYGENNLPTIMKKMSVNMEVNTRLGGYHNTQKFYSENVLKALKEYQIRNSAPNALKDKETAIEGNVSVIKNETVKSTIENLLDNPKTLNMLLTESLARTKALGIENKQLKDVIETQKPMVEGYTRIANSSGLKTIKEVANILGYGEKTYFALLRDKKILFKDNGVNLPMREYIESGYFEVKEEPFKRDGQTYLYSRVFVTAKGLLWLEKKTPKEA